MNERAFVTVVLMALSAVCVVAGVAVLLEVVFHDLGC